jgi:hypothetical protein
MGGLIDAFPVGASVAAGQLGAYAARSKGRAEKKAAYTNASNIELQSGMKASRMRKAARQEIGAQRTALGASGLQAAGSPLQLIAENAAELERRAMEETLAGQYDADVVRMGGKQARKQAKKVSAASMLEGVTRGAFYGRVPLTGANPIYGRGTI